MWQIKEVSKAYRVYFSIPDDAEEVKKENACIAGCQHTCMHWDIAHQPATIIVGSLGGGVWCVVCEVEEAC